MTSSDADRGDADPGPDAEPGPRSAGAARPFANLGPGEVLDALESQGLRCDGRLQALNSFENRVYLVGLEEGGFRVAKFYRPGRWSDAQILEEHRFAFELAEAEVPVVAPLPAADGDTLLKADGYRFAIYPRQGGRVPELDNTRDGPAMRDRIGQFIARIHRIGERTPFASRPPLELADPGRSAIDYIAGHDLLPADLREAWLTVANLCAARCREAFARCDVDKGIRLHGDCHAGNLLWTDDGPHFVDLDDCRAGPAIQDLWMLADAGGQTDPESGRPDAMLDELVDGYEKLRPFDDRERTLIEPLRTQRMLNYSAWLAERWSDPAFPAAFPWFGSNRYWQDQILYLREQLGALEPS